MAFFSITLVAIMIGAGAHSAAAFHNRFLFPQPPIINYGPPLPNWPSNNPSFSLFEPIVIVPPKIPTAQEILQEKAKAGVNFQGFSMTSSGGGTTIVTNRNGDVEAYQIGGSAPDAEDIPTIPITPIKLKPKEVPVDSNTSHYSGVSSTSFSSSSSVNGKETSIAGFNNMFNDNGDIQHESGFLNASDMDEENEVIAE